MRTFVQADQKSAHGNGVDDLGFGVDPGVVGLVDPELGFDPGREQGGEVVGAIPGSEAVIFVFFFFFFGAFFFVARLSVLLGATSCRSSC